MNFRVIFSTIGRVILIEAVLLLLPLIAAVCYRESCAFSFLITIGIALAFGGLLTLVFKPKNYLIFSKEGFVTVTLTWVFVSLIGCLPFILSGEIPHFIDAFFETVSGFTTTGATILTGDKIEALSHGVLLWRSFTHWIGGMGVLVFVMAVTSKNPDRSIHILRAEMPGPSVDKIVPRAKDTAKILYLIYIGITVILMVFLLFGGMNFFESLVYSFGTAGTGGFATKGDSIAGYNAYIQWTLAVGMFVFGINFNLYYLILVGKIRSVFKSTELKVYFLIVFLAVAGITINTFSSVSLLSDTIRAAAFQVTSIMSTTGFTTVNILDMPMLSKAILFMLMFIGGCAGSTAGGFKLSRVIILAKSVKSELKRSLHPRTANKVKFDGKSVEDATVKSVMNYLFIYILSLAIIFVLLSFEQTSFETNVSAVVSTFNNVGPAFGSAASDYVCYGYFSKFILSMSMLFGRLEIYPVILTLAPSTWLKK